MVSHLIPVIGSSRGCRCFLIFATVYILTYQHPFDPDNLQSLIFFVVFYLRMHINFVFASQPIITFSFVASSGNTFCGSEWQARITEM